MSLSNRIANNLGLDNFDRRHKIGFLLLIVAVVSITSLWVIQLRRNIISPLYGDSQTESVASNQPTQSEIDLRAKDTDSDGLNDWDELNLYKTSPYLNDTDSDTFSDKQEIDSGNDPTCPQGQTCTSVSQITTPETDTTFSNSSLENLLNSAVTQTATISPTASPATDTKQLTAEEKKALQDALGTNPKATDLRQFLLQAGMNQKTLDGLSDEQIVETFNEMIQ
ncbi:hypothetical protein IPN41_03460 [Candidatus Falkowbacteria bacterium]|nr:MAG: hypothetical protein IPN41_03460 [Candidatus Falkowbacteria bacterium]